MSLIKKVDIGFLEKKDSWQLHPRFFPSKVGGKPAWLNLDTVPHSSILTCQRCQDVLIFLCQVYAPYEESDDCFHRTIFIFICRNETCNQINSSDNFIVLRCQLPRKNEFYSYEPYDEKVEVFAMDKWSKLCYLCGIKGSSHCSKCKKAFYCCRKHQVLDWNRIHKTCCNKAQNSTPLINPDFLVTESGKSLLFTEWELIVDEEDTEEVTEVDVNKEMEKLNKMIQEKKIGSFNNVNDSELEQYTSKMPDDKPFQKFNKRIARHPDQVLRYDRGGDPLWMKANQGNINIPNCEYCNGERQFEFQIMPQLLNFLNVGLEVHSIDWGILVVYTCKLSCNQGPSYKKEILIKQDMTL